MKNPIAKTLLVGLVGGAHAELRYGTHIPFNRFWLAWGRKRFSPSSGGRGSEGELIPEKKVVR